MHLRPSILSTPHTHISSPYTGMWHLFQATASSDRATDAQRLRWAIIRQGEEKPRIEGQERERCKTVPMSRGTGKCNSSPLDAAASDIPLHATVPGKPSRHAPWALSPSVLFGPVPLVSMSPDWEISMPSHAAPAENPAMQAQGASPLVMLLAPALHEEIAAFVLLPEDKAALRASCRYRLA